MKIDPRQIPEEGLTLSGSLPTVDYDLPPGGTQGFDKIHYQLHAHASSLLDYHNL